MKKIITLSLLLIAAWASAQSLQVDMAGFKSDAGTVKVGVYTNEVEFLRTPFKSTEVKIKDGKAVATFKDLPKGTYAVSIYHDENANGKMDRNGFGMPLEAYGTSNDAKGVMGPPKFEDAKFTVAQDTKIKINVN